MNYKMIDRFVSTGLWTEEMIRVAARKGIIQEDESAELISKRRDLVNKQRPAKPTPVKKTTKTTTKLGPS